MTSLIYDTGTVSVTNGSAVVTGNGTGWAVALIRYGLFSCAGLSIPIASVESDTSLTLAYDWPGTSGAERPYALYLNSDHAGNAVWTNRLITDVIKNLSLVGIHPDGAGTLAERNALSPVPQNGFIWLRVEPGFDLEITRKVSSGWEGPFTLRGHGGVGTGGLGLPSPGAANQVPFYSAPGTISLTSLTSYARGLLGASDGADLQDAMGINNLRDYAVSLLPDSGRFAGNSAKSTTIGAFESPSYLNLYNGTTVESAGKFITNNADYGGAAGNLAAVVKDLVDKIRGPSYRRYGVEFHVAQFTMGSGTSSAALNIGGTNYYISLFPTFGPMVPAMTFHAYVRALDAPIVMRLVDGQTIILDGVRSATHQVIAPADGWVSMTIHHQLNPYESLGYQPDLFQVRCSASGHRYLLACLAVMGGITDVDDNVGVIAGINRWLP